MYAYNIITLLIVITAIFSYVNFRFFKLPATIGIMLFSLVASLCVFVLGLIFPALSLQIKQVVQGIDFYGVLMNGMLSFLLFAGAIHINIRSLKNVRTSVVTFSTIGVLISTIMVAVLFYVVAKWFGLNIDFIYCLLFGSLISPTDPIAVLGILKQAKIPASLETKISGESLFNDGVAVVVFIAISEVIKVGIQNISLAGILWLFLREAVGGVVFGVMLGYLGFYLIRSVDNYIVEVLITLAIVTGGYSVADYLHTSGPLAMVVAGIITGNKSRDLVMSDITKDYIDKFWEMIDEVLNAVLFLLIGFEMLVIHFNQMLFWLGCITIVIVLFARYVSVSLPIVLFRFSKTFPRNEIRILTWGGLRGGISVALALSLPASEDSQIFVSVTYIVVLFSILVQGLTIGKLAKKLC